MYGKNVIKMLAEHGAQSIYGIAKAFGVSEGSIYSAITRLRRVDAIRTDENLRIQLTDFGWRLYEGIKALESAGEAGINKGEFGRRFGRDVVEALKRLRVLAEKIYVYVERRLLDPLMNGSESELPEGYLVAGVIDPNDNFIPITVSEPPKYVNSPAYGELKHVGGGIYVPKAAVQESLWDYLPSILRVVAPIVFGIGLIAASSFKT
jgi:hypothetical protein